MYCMLMYYTFFPDLAWFARCTFEMSNEASCPFYNDVSGEDDADWIIHSVRLNQK